jgi:AcrR family transcriptional regulator
MSHPMSAHADGRRVRGDRSRHAVLEHAIHVASVHGLHGLSFGQLADSSPVNKSGIAGLFGSKEGLQLATVEQARLVFVASVVEPARVAGPGLPRLWALVEHWLAYSRDRVFLGGCFFRAAAAELDAVGPGAVRDAVVDAVADWHAYLSHQAQVAVAAGHLDADTDVDQLAFELRAFLEAADDASVLLGDPQAYVRAEKAAQAALVARGATGI